MHTLSDEEFKKASEELQTLLKKYYGDSPIFSDLFEMLGGHLIGCAFAAFRTANVKDRATIEMNRDMMIKMLTGVFNVYTETYLKRAGETSDMFDKLETQMKEQFGEFQDKMTEAQKEMVEMFSRFGVDTTKMKQ